MTTVTLTSAKQRPLRPLIEAALDNQLRLIKAGSDRAEARMREFEATHGLSTQEFVKRFENDELQETLEFIEWIGEYRMLARLQQKAELLAEIEIAD
ncbi:MAG: hypothetical protein JXC32_19490 [Anaerolineae bacterium]|nr:hypothetical protein [Anaerolineae bacterium]